MSLSSIILPIPTRVVIVSSLNKQYPALDRNIIPVLPNSILRILLPSTISPLRSNRSKKEYKGNLLSSISEGVFAIYSYQRYKRSKEPYKVGNGSEKYTKYIRDQQPYNLSVPPSVLRRIYKERLRLRYKVYKARVKFSKAGIKLNRLETELQVAEDKEEDLVRLE